MKPFLGGAGRFSVAAAAAAAADAAATSPLFTLLKGMWSKFFRSEGEGAATSFPFTVVIAFCLGCTSRKSRTKVTCLKRAITTGSKTSREND